MSSGNLVGGAFVTTVDGRRCTAVPKPGANVANAAANANPNGNDDSFNTQAESTAAAQDAAETAAAITATSGTGSTSTTSSSLTTDTSIISTASVAEAQPTQGRVTALSDVNDPATSPTGDAIPLFTTIGTASNDAAEQATDVASSSSGVVSAVPSSNNNAVQSTVAVAGGVIGGVILISAVAFFVWWWRRRVMKKRRSTLLTPLTIDNTFGPGEKGPYVINRSSIGPTPMSERVRSAIGYNVMKIRGRFSRIVTRSSTDAPSVNMNRGNSQFMEPVSTHSRANSSALSGSAADVTSKDRFLDWWSRLTADVSFNWRLRNKKSSANNPFGTARGSSEKKASLTSQPDFLTLLGMDEREIDREAQRRRASVSRKNGSAGSAEHFLGGLNLTFGSNSNGNSNSNPDDPFSDANALSRSSAKPAPLVVSQPNNPFSDSNAISGSGPTVPKPSTYIADIRRSRNQSVSGNPNWPASTLGRESVASVESYTVRRNNKFRSDPFDLERPELLASARQAKASMSSSTAGTAGSSDGARTSRLSGGVGTGELRRPPGAHARSDSFSSKYSSGVSMGDWSDPGPDVGPAVSRRDSPERRESPTQAWRSRLEKDAAKGNRPRRDSGGSVNSVGKAM
ncbi:hypothetical protein QBC33DRAFT_453344 [Phialemonium atrogriseum]|uniref:Uncharacterized protein n=1 Tax=Phialemonium atrogriseum TaxID=1093897 RepID=A0AAJ0BZQ1_9PEZI|nr:uncharacterized protein QBC33DRAFT_453344 [Phialemonium atrogriseum]KAK1766413.1 hypothetical protein QBC33DRAFT_453344 [Phialemonium atrogriseum]